MLGGRWCVLGESVELGARLVPQRAVRGQLDDDARATVRVRRFDPGRAAVEGYELTHHRESDTAAAHRRFSAPAQPHIWLPHPIAIGGGDFPSFILHPQTYAPPLRRRRRRAADRGWLFPPPRPRRVV